MSVPHAIPSFWPSVCRNLSNLTKFWQKQDSKFFGALCSLPYVTGN